MPQELDVIVGWIFREAVAYTVLDSGVPIVHVSETSVEHPLSVSPLGLQKVAEQLAHHVAALLDRKGHVLGDWRSAAHRTPRQRAQPRLGDSERFLQIP